jgi:hypothetical protein
VFVLLACLFVCFCHHPWFACLTCGWQYSNGVVIAALQDDSIRFTPIDAADVRYGDRQEKTERERVRETERQRDRETERQRNRDRERGRENRAHLCPYSADPVKLESHISAIAVNGNTPT